MRGREVNLEAVPDLSSHLYSEYIRQRLAGVDIKVIHDQVDGFSVRVLQRQIASHLGEFKR